MHIKFNVDELLPQLAMVTSIVNAKNVISVLDNVLIEPISKGQDNASIKMTASDNDNRISLSAAVLEVSEDCIPLCVSAKSLSQTLKSLTGMILSIEVNEAEHLLTGTYKNGKFTIPFHDAGDFPTAFDGGEEQDCVETSIQASVFASAIGNVEFAVSDDVLRPIISGIRADFSEQGYTLVSTDAQKLIKVAVQTPCAISGGFTLPAKPARIISSMFSKSETSLAIKFNYRNVLFSADGFELHSRLIEGRYPNVESIMPKDNNIVFEVEREKLLSALRRTMVLGNQRSCLVVISLEMGNVKVEAEDIDFSTSATENIECNYAGTPIKIGFKGTNLQQIVQNIASDKICFKLKESNLAALICPATSNDCVDLVSLLMPMMING